MLDSKYTPQKILKVFELKFFFQTFPKLIHLYSNLTTKLSPCIENETNYVPTSLFDG